MNHPLDGARLKIIRAQEHLTLLKDEIGRYLDTHPYELITKQQGYWEVYPRITEEPPLRMGSIVGDCAANVMPALDYIMWELVTKFAPFTIQPPPLGHDKPSFPLYVDPDRFGKNTHRFERYNLPADVVSEIEAVQPFNRGYEPLWLLYLLISADKHRLPALTTAYIRGIDVMRKNNDTWTWLMANQPLQRGIITIHDGTSDEPAFVTPRTRPSDAPVQMHFQAALYVTLQDVAMPREPVERTLEQIIKTAADVIPRFDRFF